MPDECLQCDHSLKERSLGWFPATSYEECGRHQNRRDPIMLLTLHSGKAGLQSGH
jgi:hypothetical protein